jgi:predicted alpha/beta superfamily hydrolase
MSLTPVRAFLVAVVFAAGVLAPRSGATVEAVLTVEAEPDMVQPELLPQGFVLVVTDERRMATADAPIYFASSINGWDPADPDSVLSPRSDTRWQIIVDDIPANTTIAFKMTMGGWDREELDEAGGTIGNRSLPKIDRSKLTPGERPVIEISVPQFRTPVALSEQVRQSGPYRRLDVTGDVRRIEVRGGPGAMEATTRDLLVWLPPGYDAPENAGRTYPVLYMMDGQNIFEPPAGLAAEWGADETAQRLVEAGEVRPLIIVGVPHAGEHRMSEYLPFSSINGHAAMGDEFVSWLRREAMPRVERAFRVKTGAENTGIGGASLGGAISLYAATKHPGVFGRVLVESLPMLGDDGLEARAYLDGVQRWPERVFIGMGGRETGNADTARNEMYVAWAGELAERASAAGVSPDSFRSRIDPQANHNELAWAARFPDALKFLFPAGD